MATGIISTEQIKAARALLNWNQAVLAERAGISKPALANMESGKAKPRVETLTAITNTLEDAGIEFMDGGVRLTQQKLNVQILEGEDALFRLWKDMADTLKDGDERLISGVDEKKFEGLAGSGDKLRGIIKKFHDRNITSRIFLKEGDNYLVEPREHYRWVSEELFSQVPYFIYANKYAIMLFEPNIRIVLIENKAIADSYRTQFDAIWAQSEMPTAG